MKLAVRKLTLAGIALALTAPVHAHLGYNGRDFGAYLSSTEKTVTINVTNILGTFGWADGTDGDWGDSHNLRIFKFDLADPMTIHVAARGFGGFLPAFSVYSGLADPVSADHEGAPISIQYRDSFGTKEGNFIALDTWKIASDADTNVSQMSTFTYVGHAADGTSANFGAVPGIAGDGIADAYVTRAFDLPAGSYSFFVGGADYAGTNPANQAASITVSNVPEPATAATLMAGLTVLGGMRPRRRE